MTEWCTATVAARLEEAADTGRRLPAVRVQGYYTVWPVFARDAYETLADNEKVYRSFPPSPKQIDRMLETMRWVQWLTQEERHLVWMRAKRYPWREIGIRNACCSKTAQRHWQRALQTLTSHLNGAATPAGN